MNGGFIPSANLHSPGPIGDVTPGTVGTTALTVNGSPGTITATQPISGESFRFNSGARLRSPDGSYVNITAGDDSTPARVNLGSATSGNPGLKANGTVIESRYADDSGYADLKARIFFGGGAGLDSVPGALTIDSGWTANADAGDKTKVIASSASTATIGAALDIISAGSGTLLIATAEKLKALETALVALLAPNA